MPLPSASAQSCRHDILQLEPSPFAALAGYQRPDAEQRAAARIYSPSSSSEKKKLKQKKNDVERESRTFPAPLVLPHDELNYDPEAEPQSLTDWADGEQRNAVTDERRTIYVVGYPEVGGDVKSMGVEEWTRPRKKKERGGEKDNGNPHQQQQQQQQQQPNVDEIIEYLQAFYHGMRVQRLPTTLTYRTWTDAAPKKASASKARSAPRAAKAALSTPRYIALQHGVESTRIRARPCPDGSFDAQLNLDDLLDALLRIVPQDAYAIMLLVDHDIYESEEDDFCCGRAYGGSRICVVQTARYNPILDEKRQEHVWPMSHCRAFVDAVCEEEEKGLGRRKVTAKEARLSAGPGGIRRAIAAAVDQEHRGDGEGVTLWTTRVAQTASHELGHCLGMDHCVYYSCLMQGVASMAEDPRCPPFLCLVCEAKLGYAIRQRKTGSSSLQEGMYEKERLEALRKFCEENGREKALMWRALGAWMDARLEQWSEEKS